MIRRPPRSTRTDTLFPYTTLFRSEGFRIGAEAVTGSDGVTVQSRQAAITAADLPESVLQYVVRAKESVLLNDAERDNRFSADAYIRRQHARSILCLPLLKQARLVGLLRSDERSVGNECVSPCRSRWSPTP